MQTRDIMTTPVVTVAPSASLAEAAELMTRHRFTTLPVVDRSGKLLGLVSETDLVRAGFPGEPTGGDPDTGAMLGSPRTVAAVMRTPGVVAETDLGTAELGNCMAEAGVRALPVMDRGALVGMVTFQDVLRALCPQDDRRDRTSIWS
ncbi:HPP family protein [Amycolatopsis sp. NPDC051903]|uniref:HPP family protein n=1 Tax=Amycolatopsis sp. NPDC051903 TaxID=3363936 RepID=UPI0037938587